MFNFKNSNSGRIKLKLLATLLVITLTFANFALVGSYIGEAIAVEIDLTKQDNSTNNDNVKFELYFAENNSNQISKDINAKDLVLYAKVSVENAGLLENAKIELTDTSFKLQEGVDETSLNVGTLKAGESKTLELPIEIKRDGNVFNLGLLNMFSKITLTGTYTNQDNATSIGAEKYVQVNWTSEAIDLIPEEEPKPIELTQELVTNKIYKIGETEQRVIQYKITSGITNNQYPIKSTTIGLQAPRYEETTKQMLKEEQIVEGVNWVAPEQAMVTAYSLNASNPNEILNLKETEQLTPETTGFVYNQEEGKIDINILNKEDENNEATWNKKGQDEFIVTYIYPVDVVIEEIESIATSQIALHDLDNRVLSSDKNINTQTITEEFGDIVTFKTDASASIYKSNMYIGEETLYATQLTTKISYPGVAGSVKITNGVDKLKTVENQEIASQTYYKNTYINKKELDYILGSQGSLKIFNSANLDTPIAEINNQTETSADGVITVENGNITVNYQNPIETILIEIVNPANAGLLNIYNQKAIKIDNSEEIMSQMPSAKKLDIATGVVAMQGENEIVNLSTTNTIDLQEPVSDAEFGMDKTGFATLNENLVNFTIILKTDDLKYDLYENPIITIALPDVVENIEATIDDVAILNDNGLQKQNLVIDNNQIILTLSGKQLGYSNTNTNTRISVNARITTNKLIPTMSREVVAKVVNGKTTVYPNSGEAVVKTQPINLEAEQGILLATSISNYNSSNTTLTAFEGNVAGELEEKVGAKVATVVGTVINNTKTDLQEVVIFGKVQKEGTSINTALNSEVLVQNKIGENQNLQTEIYYTEDANPSINSNWANSATPNTTAYRIVCKNISKTSAIEFRYNVVIPENLDTNRETLINYEVYSNDQTYTAPEIKLQTPKEVKLNLELTANVQNGDEVYEGQNIEYNIKITNNGETDAENVTLNIATEGLNIYEGQTVIEGLNIQAGQSVEKQIKTTVNKDVTNISVTAEATTAYLLAEAKNTLANTVSKPGIELDLYKEVSTFSIQTKTAQKFSVINYQLTVTNTLEEDLKDIQIVDVLPEELEFEELYVYKIVGEEITTLNLEQLEYKYSEETKELKIEINQLKMEEKILISIDAEVEKIVDSTINNSICVTANEKYSNIIFNVTDETQVIGEPIITSSLTSNKQGTLKVGDIVEYTIKVKNTGETTEYISLEYELPEQLSIQSAYCYYVESEKHDVAINFNKISINHWAIKQNQELTIVIIANVNEIMSNIEIENQVIITGVYTNQTTNKIEQVIIGTGENSNQNPGENPGQTPGENPGNNPDQTPGENSTSIYSISGVAWEDENKNGARELEEKLLKNIIVKIIDADTNKYLVDEEGNEIEQVTNKDGVYEFKDLKPGKYILIYEYNKTTYSPTAYQKIEVDNLLNSDARLVTEENKNITKTDIIEIKNSNISNIDIGLTVNPIFDLKLDKYITKVTVQNPNGTKVYEYDKTQLAKVEIPAKVLEGSLVIVEYQIDVTNEGAVPAHVDSIVDYVSPQFEFKSELNTTWYKANDNNLYCIEFANKDLNPGETVSTKLVLTKTMTNDNVGLVNNAAEIYETFNEYAFEDVDSVPANKEQEDDLSEADIIISIKTGGPLLYIGIVIISMFILSAGIYLINKKVIKNDII